MPYCVASVTLSTSARAGGRAVSASDNTAIAMLENTFLMIDSSS
jgi:hypothetical protein